jgi:hypothetical protein
MSKYLCHRKECTRIRSEFSLFLNRRRPPQYEGHTFCSDSCLWAYVESELGEKWQRFQLETNRKMPRPKLGTILMQTARITRNQVEEAVKLQNQNRKGRIGEWLLRLGFVEERQITEALALQYGLPWIHLQNSSANADALRMIPGKVAKCSGLIPMGFDDNQRMLRVAAAAPIDFNSQEAIRRMVHKGIVTYVGDQSAIQQLLAQWYEPEDLDMSNVPAYSSLGELIAIGNDIVAAAIDQRAQDIQAELLQDFFWVRLDFLLESHHHFYKYTPGSAHKYEQDSGIEMAMVYAAAH